MMDDIPLRARQSSLGDASRYLDVGYEPLYPFGYGRSYTEFKYANLRLSTQRAKLNDTIQVSVDLTNTGKMEAEEIAQLYTRDLVASLTRPVKELKGFKKIRLKPGETTTVTFDLPINSLGFNNSQMRYVVEPGAFKLRVGGDSQSGLESNFEVVE
jgi:beta-glucosidase